MVPEPEKIEDFDDLEDERNPEAEVQDTPAGLDDSESAPDADEAVSAQVEDDAEEIEELDSDVDEAPEMVFAKENLEMSEGEEEEVGKRGRWRKEGGDGVRRKKGEGDG